VWGNLFVPLFMQNKLKTIESFFSSVSFVEKSHTYYVENKKLSTSVSGVVKSFVEEVDFVNIAKSIDKRDSLKEGVTKRLWDLKAESSCALGNRVHFFGEVYTFNKSILPNNKYEDAVVAFWKSLPKHIVPVFTELEMYHIENMFGGTADIILYNTQTEKFIIADYKTNENLFKCFKNKMLKGIFKDLLENSFNKYQIQFSLYQILFEQSGFEVERRLLVWLRPNGEFEMYDTEDYTHRLKVYLENNSI
tara:strand:- start:5487 stop:6233 length:747 start_codon:yes stop_codon:yes gene_type:complete